MQPANLLDRIMTPFVPARFECRRLADRLRLKTAWHTDPESLRRDAEDMVRRDMGNFPSEEPFDPDEDEDESMAYESAMRSLANDIFEGLQETDPILGVSRSRESSINGSVIPARLLRSSQRHAFPWT
jgi:hypothetical protein